MHIQNRYKHITPAPLICKISLIFIAYICLAIHTADAQNTKEKMSYYDSLIHSELSKPPKPQKKIGEKENTQKNSKTKKGKKNKKSNKQSNRKDQNTEANSTIENESQIIDKVFLEEKAAAENSHGEYPSPIWYGKDFSDSRVRKHNHATLDSLPDEIRIQLVKDSNDFCFPIKNVITSPYGWRERWNRPHRGVDIALRTGDKIYCCFDGIVRIARPLGAYGNLVVVRHYNGLETIYGHLSKIYVKPKQKVNAGTVLGLGGSTGRSTGPHLHFEVRFQYEAFDPEWILDLKTYSLRTKKLYLDKTYFGIKKPKNKKEHAIYKADESIIKEEEVENPTQQIKYKEPRYHTAKKGDTWKKLSEKYKISVKRLKRLNSAKDDYIKPGTQIRLN